MTALICACVDGRLEATRTLVASGANVNVVDQNGWTPLNCARGRIRLATPAIEALLLAAGATAGADWVAGNGDDDEEEEDEEGEGGDADDDADADDGGDGDEVDDDV
jgi:hypothetical protein